jgi:hypothetical protein
MANSRADVISAVVAVGGVVAVVSFLAWRRRQSTWTGVVTGTINLPGDNEGSQPICAVMFRTDAGRSVKLGVASAIDLAAYPVGARYEKKSGQTWPVRI